MIKRLLVVIFLSVLGYIKAQCPQVFNYLGTPTSQPLFISCTGSVYALNFQSNSNWGAYTINWGDLTGNSTGTAYTANSIITHSYAVTVNSFVITLTIPSQTCVMTGTVVMEKPVNASIQIPTLGLTTACAPKTLTFTNSSTDVSPTTTFTWNFGDGSSQVVTSFTNANTNVLHQYNKGTVNCQTQVTLKAQNYCSFGNPTMANFNPINIYDTDSAIIVPDKIIRCWPDNVFTFNNGSIRNCLSQGNTFQRQERWKFGNYWSLGHDSIVGWKPWPPSAPNIIAYPAIGTYTAMLQDSSLCGVKSTTISVIITSPPTASLVAPSGPLCQNTPITFTNQSSSGFSYRWDFGTGSGFVNLGSGNKTNTYGSAGTFTVKLLALITGAANSCSDTSKKIITILPSPTASFVVTPTAGCNILNNVNFTNASTVGTSLLWNFANGNTSTLSAPPVQSYTSSGLYTATLSATTPSGCVNSYTGNILVRPNPLPAFSQFTTCVSSQVTFTNNSTTTGTNPITSYTWNFGDGSAISTGSAPAHTYTAPNTYTVKLIASSAFCSDSLKQTVLLNVKPTASFVTSSSVGCSPLSVSFSNTSSNANTYTWKFGPANAASSSATNALFTYTNSTQNFLNYTVTLISSTGAGCADSVKKAISVKPNPVASFTANGFTGCSPKLTTFSNTSVGYTTSQWTFSNGIGTSTSNNPSFTFSNQTLFTQTVSTKLVVTNSVSCTDSTSQIITLYPQALPVFTPMPNIGCHPLVVNFPAIPGIATYTWDHGDSSPSFTTSNAHSYTFANTGTTNIVYTVSMTALTSNGCIGNNTQTVTVYANPLASFAYSPTIACSPVNINFTNTSVGNATNFWNFGNGQVSIFANPTASFVNQAGAPQASVNVKLTVSTANNCKDSTIKTVLLYPQPKAQFNLDTPACSPKVISFTNTSTSGAVYNWNFGDGGSSTNTNPSHSFVNNSSINNTLNVKLIATSSNNCRDSLIVPVVIHPKPNFNITSYPDSGCSPLRVFFTKIGGVASYVWKYDNISFGNSGDISNTFENKAGNTRIYNIDLIATDVYNCVDTASKSIKVYPVPVANYSVSPLTVYIPNQSAQFTNLSTSAASYTYSFGDGSKSNDINPTHTYAGAGEYTTSLIVTSNKGCRDTFKLPEVILALNETTVIVPNAFTPSAAGPKGGLYDPKDLSNDVFYPNIKGTEKYSLSIYTRWGELMFETANPEEGWDGYYKGTLCTQDVYIWKITAKFVDGRTYNKTGDLLLLR